jgi:hypothetical protein
MCVCIYIYIYIYNFRKFKQRSPNFLLKWNVLRSIKKSSGLFFALICVCLIFEAADGLPLVLYILLTSLHVVRVWHTIESRQKMCVWIWSETSSNAVEEISRRMMVSFAHWTKNGSGKDVREQLEIRSARAQNESEW